MRKLKPFTTYMDHYFPIFMSDVPPEAMGIKHPSKERNTNKYWNTIYPAPQL